MEVIKYIIIRLKDLNGKRVCINTETKEEQQELIKELESLGINVRSRYVKEGYEQYGKDLCVSIDYDQTYFGDITSYTYTNINKLLKYKDIKGHIIK